MSNIESKLDQITSGISNLNDSINRLIDKMMTFRNNYNPLNLVFQQINLLQAITAFQVYRINKQTKGLIR